MGTRLRYKSFHKTSFFAPAGNLCEHEVDECQSDPCYHSGRCVDSLASFSCDCQPGYHGTFCEMEQNECESRPCLNGATCHDLVANYRLGNTHFISFTAYCC